MTKHIFRSICIAAIAVFMASLLLIMGILCNCLSSQQMKSLRTETTLCVPAVEKEGADYLLSIADGDYRITWISADGSVLFDNKVQTDNMDNHLEREEIKKAIQNGEGESVRCSDTMMEPQIYSARKLSGGTILRLSESRLTLWPLIIPMFRPIVFVIIIAIGLFLFFAYRLSRHIVKPLNELDLDNLNTNCVYEEITPFVSRIKSQQQQLRVQKAELLQKQKELDTATESMNEYSVLLSESGTVLNINKSATRVFRAGQYHAEGISSLDDRDY